MISRAHKLRHSCACHRNPYLKMRNRLCVISGNERSQEWTSITRTEVTNGGEQLFTRLSAFALQLPVGQRLRCARLASSRLLCKPGSTGPGTKLNACGEWQWIPAHWSGRDDDGERWRNQNSVIVSKDEDDK